MDDLMIPVSNISCVTTEISALFGREAGNDASERACMGSRRAYSKVEDGYPINSSLEPFHTVIW